MPWKELSKIALLGTDRTAISPALKKALAELGVDSEMDSAQLVLKGAAILQAQKRAATIAEKWSAPIPAMPAGAEENHCSSKSTRHLEMILDGPHKEAFNEFIDWINVYHKTLTPRFIPVILERALDDGELRNTILPLIGPRGKWLAQQNPKWAMLFSETNLDDWEAADLDTRIVIFEQARSNDPQKALELLEKEWGSLKPKHKIAFLQKMITGLNEADEAFLENCLYESRKEIRQLASNLLSRLPHSQLNQRMWERLQLFIEFKKGTFAKEKPIITLPDSIDETMIRDGIDPRHQWKSGGLKASRLGQMITLMPPSRWEREYEKSPEELITIFLRSEWAVLFLQAFSQAAILHDDKKWMQALLTAWIKNNANPVWYEFNPEPILKAIDAGTFNEVCLLALKVDADFASEEGPLFILIRSSKNIWSADLSKNLIGRFQKWMAKQESTHWGSWHYKTVLKKASYHCSTEVHEALRKNWPTEAVVWSAWQREIELFLSTLQFRAEMKRELETK